MAPKLHLNIQRLDCEAIARSSTTTTIRAKSEFRHQNGDLYKVVIIVLLLDSVCLDFLACGWPLHAVPQIGDDSTDNCGCFLSRLHAFWRYSPSAIHLKTFCQQTIKSIREYKNNRYSVYTLLLLHQHETSHRCKNSGENLNTLLYMCERSLAALFHYECLSRRCS